MAETDYKINVTADTSQADAALNSSASTISKIESVSKRLGTYVSDVSSKIKSAFDYASKGVTNYDEELKKALVSTSSVKNAIDQLYESLKIKTDYYTLSYADTAIFSRCCHITFRAA